MDKIKDIFRAVFIKHQFWTLSVIIMLLLLGVWWMSSGRLKSEFDKNFTEVDTAQKAIVQIHSKPENQIFNVNTHTGMKEMNAVRRREVYLAWREMEERQRREVLVWPEGLSQKFIKEIEKKLKGRPIEELEPTTDGTDHLVFSLREEYRDEIKGLLPKLADMIDAEWAPQEAAARGGDGHGGGFGGGHFEAASDADPRRSRGAPPGPNGAAKSDKTYAVWWSPADQGAIEATYFDWSDSETLPTTMEILYSMEDYWVLKALMQIIARTNADDEGHAPTRPELATIREIHALHIGKAVESNAGQIYLVQSTSAAEAGEVPPTVGAVPPATAGEVPPLGTEGAVPAGPNPAEGRYVDKAYKPLTAEALKKAASPDSSDTADAYLTVAKRMPVRMLVKMDQRKLNRFLVECGNADLMLEVKQVRINPDAPDVLSVANNTTRDGGDGGFGGGHGRAGGAGGEGQRPEEGKFPWDVMVEVYGIIYIFNPPSPTRLTDQLSEEEIKEFEASIKESAVASATTPATTSKKPAAIDDAGAGDTAEESADGAPADAGAAPEDSPPAEDTPPADKTKKPAKPPRGDEAARDDGAAVPAG